MVEYFLSLSPETSGILNIFSYLSTRTIISTLTGLLLVLLFGDKFIQLYTSIKLVEFEQFNKVISSWEREHLLLNV